MGDPDGSPNRARLPFLPALEGLRGVAVGVILLYHAGFSWMSGGFLGVSTFFTLSGFLITALLVGEHERHGRIDLGTFYARRLRRILPAALLALAGIVLFGALAAEVSQRMRLRGDGLSALLYVANWWLMATGADYASQLGAPSPVQHFWSLAIEEQFYLVHPWLVLLALRGPRGSRRRLAVLLGALVAACWVWSAWLEHGLVSNARLFYGTDTRAAELFVGALLALALHPLSASATTRARSGITALGVLGLVVSAAFWNRAAPDDPFLFRGGLALYAVASATIVAAASLPTGLVRALLSWTLPRWLGRISYGAYLYHWPIYLWLDGPRTGLGLWALTALRVALTLVLAEISLRLIEEPIRSRRRLHAWRRWAVPGAAIGAVVAGLLATTRGVSGSWSAVTLPRAAESSEAHADQLRVVVFGDSVAESVGEGLERWGQRTGRAWVQALADPGCGVARGPRADERSAAQVRARIRCDHWQLRWEPGLQRVRPQLIVMLTSGWDLVPRRLPAWTEPRSIGDPVFDEWMRSELSAAVRRLSIDRARVVWLTAPCVKPRAQGPVGIFDPVRTRHFNEAILAPLALAESTRMTLIDLFAKVCPGGEFTNTLDGIDGLRPDGIHFSEAGADWLAAWLGPQLVALAAPRTHL